MLGSIMVRSSDAVTCKELAEIIRLLEKKTVITRTTIRKGWRDTDILVVTTLISGIVDTTYIHIVLEREIDKELRKLEFMRNRVTALTVLDIQEKLVMTKKELLIHEILRNGSILIRPM